MNQLLRIALCHPDGLVRLRLTVALQAGRAVRVVVTARNATELLTALERVPVDRVVCGGDYACRSAKGLRLELWRRGLPVVTVRHPERPASQQWLRVRCARCARSANRP